MAKANENGHCGDRRWPCVRHAGPVCCGMSGARSRRARMELFEAMYTLRSMRRLKPDPIPDEQIRTILDAAIRAASGGNQQNWAFIVVRDRALKDQIAPIYLDAWRALRASGYGQA